MCKLATIKEEIEDVRSRLDTAIRDGANREDILAISRMLDSLIYQYYSRETQKKRNWHVYKDEQR